MWLRHSKLNEHEQKLLDMSREEFDSYMIESYPEMFQMRAVKEGQKVLSPMNFGFEIGPGWRHVLDSLCKKLKVIQDLAGLICVFTQIKEKFGSARFYYCIQTIDSYEKKDGHEELYGVINDLVDLYEEYTNYVCEELGTNIKNGEKVSTGSWMYGMSMEGFEKWVKKSNPKYSDEKIKIAKRSIDRKRKTDEIKDGLYYLSDEDLQKVQDVVEKIKEEMT